METELNGLTEYFLENTAFHITSFSIYALWFTDYAASDRRFVIFRHQRVFAPGIQGACLEMKPGVTISAMFDFLCFCPVHPRTCSLWFSGNRLTEKIDDSFIPLKK